MARDDTWHVGSAVFGSNSIPKLKLLVHTSITHPFRSRSYRSASTAQGSELPSAPARSIHRHSAVRGIVT
jgi:hypothetical protein